MKGPKGVKAGSVSIDDELLGTLSRGQWWQLALGDDTDAQSQEALHGQFELQKKALDRRFEDKVEKVRRGDDLPPGVMKMVKVFIAVKRQACSPATRWPAATATRASSPRWSRRRTCPSSPTERPSTSSLNPLGVPSRMNVGQILETPHGLGRARPRQGHRRGAAGVPPRRVT